MKPYVVRKFHFICEENSIKFLFLFHKYHFTISFNRKFIKHQSNTNDLSYVHTHPNPSSKYFSHNSPGIHLLTGSSFKVLITTQVQRTEIDTSKF